MSVHVVHIIDHLGLGGAQRLLADLAVRQVEQGLRVTLINLRNETDLSRRIVTLGIPVHSLSLSKWSPRQLFALITLLRTLKPALVHLHLMTAHVLGRLAAVSAGVPAVVVHDHDASAEVYTHPGPLLVLRRMVEPLAPPARTAYITLSADAVEYSIRIRHWPRAAVYCVPNGVDPAYFADVTLSRTEARTQLGFPHDRRIIGYAGRLSIVKGIDCLIDALVLLPTDISLAVAGNGPLRAQLEARADALGLQQRVYWLGQVADLRPFLRACDAYVQPSRREPFGLSVAEAAVMGLPIVATNVGGIRDFIHHEQTGLLVQPDQPRELAAAVQYILNDPDRAQAFGMAAQAYVTEHFDVRASVARIASIYQTLLEQ